MPSQKPPNNLPDRPEIAFHKGRADELQISYNALRSDLNKLEAELAAVTKAKDAIIYAMKARQGFWIGVTVASVVFGMISLVIRWR